MAGRSFRRRASFKGYSSYEVHARVASFDLNALDDATHEANPNICGYSLVAVAT